MNGKAQFDLATKEVIAFCHQTLGYNDVMLRCDNEPSVLQLLRLVVQARQQMCLQTQACTPSAYQHGNALAKNAIQRIRGLAGSLMHSLWGYNQFQPCTLDLAHASCSVDSEQVQPTPRADSFRSGIWQSLPWPGL